MVVIEVKTRSPAQSHLSCALFENQYLLFEDHRRHIVERFWNVSDREEIKILDA